MTLDGRTLDAGDPLACLRDRFTLPEGIIYLDGNSLGPLPRNVSEHLGRVTREQWGEDLIRSWNAHDWIDLPVIVGERIARLIGAAPGQVICGDSVSINLFKCLSAALAGAAPRRAIVTPADNFPTDIYVAEGLAQISGDAELRLVEADRITEALGEDVAVLMMTEVNFRTGERYDMAAITRAAHDAGVLALWDLSHSSGALPVALDEAGADFAVGCGYKFLCGGPGAPAFLYVAQRHQHRAQPLSGWMGHAAPFEFSPRYTPAPGIRRFAAGTPSVLAMSALDAALTVFDGVTTKALYEKSQRLTQFFIDRVRAEPALGDLTLISPLPPERRGSQVSLGFGHAYAVIQALIGRGVIGDFRTPDVMRFGFSPLFNTFAEAESAVSTLAQVVGSGAYREPGLDRRQRVT